jgi:hypothetical protein
MRRFGQFIRQAGHFGKPPPHVDKAHQKAAAVLPIGKALLSKKVNRALKSKG